MTTSSRPKPARRPSAKAAAPPNNFRFLSRTPRYARSARQKRASGRVLVAQAADGDDAAGRRRFGLDLRTQPLDVHVEGLGVADVIGPPDPVDQRVP